MDYFRKLAAERYGLPLSTITAEMAYKTKSDFYRILVRLEKNPTPR